MLNCRPLTPMSSDVEDIQALTPGHFLATDSLSAISVPDYSELPLNKLSQWQLLQRLHHEFWRRWHCEYLHIFSNKELNGLNQITFPTLEDLFSLKMKTCLIPVVARTHCRKIIFWDRWNSTSGFGKNNSRLGIVKVSQIMSFTARMIYFFIDVSSFFYG